jgi:hypothetical protein
MHIAMTNYSFSGGGEIITGARKISSILGSLMFSSLNKPRECIYQYPAKDTGHKTHQ